MVMFMVTSFSNTTLNCLMFFYNVHISEPGIRGRGVEVDWGGVVIIVGSLIALLWMLWWTKDEVVTEKKPDKPPEDKNTCPGTCGKPFCKGLSEDNIHDCILADLDPDTHTVICTLKEGMIRSKSLKLKIREEINTNALGLLCDVSSPSELARLNEFWYVHCGKCLKPHPCNPKAPSFKLVRNIIPKVRMNYERGWKGAPWN